MKPLKDKTIQARVDIDELAQFVEVKHLLNAKTNSDAIRQMTLDEKKINDAVKNWDKDDGSLLPLLKENYQNQGRLPMLQVMHGIANTDSQVKLDKLWNTYQNLDVQLSSLLWSMSNLTNNLNQVAHALNIAKDEDPDDENTWNWTNAQLVKLMQTGSAIKYQLSTIQVALGLREKDVKTHVSPGNTFLPE